MGTSEKPRHGSESGESPTRENSPSVRPEQSNAIEQSTSHELSGDELTDRLRLESPDLIEDISKIAKEQLASEIGREAALNGKATALLTSSGLALTVAFTFGGLILQHPEYLDNLGSPWAYLVPVLYAAALISGLTASGFALRAQLIRDDYVGVSATDVFNPDVLLQADQLDLASLVPSSKPDATSPSSEAPPKEQTSRPLAKAGVSYYRRYMVAALWRIYQTHFTIHEAKAKQIWTGQRFFGAFLAILAIIGVILAVVSGQQLHARFAVTSSQHTVGKVSDIQPPAATRAPELRTGRSKETPPTVRPTPSIDAGVALPKDGG